MRILFNEQDVIDGVCVFVSSRYKYEVREVRSELFYTEGRGFSAAAEVQNGRYKFQLTEQDIIDGAAMYLSEYHQFDPYTLSIELLFEEGKGFSAVIDKN